MHTGTVQGTVVSVYEVGCFFGALLAFFIGEKLGRRRMMILGGVIMIIGTIITTASFGPGDPPHGNVGGFVQFIISRVITGVGNGMNTATIPTWVAESSKAHNRGFLICIEASTVAVGTVIAYWVVFGLSYVDSSVAWRFPIAFQIFFAVLLICGVLVLPESPRWLMKHGHDTQALKVIAALEGTSMDSEIAISEKNKMSDALAAQAHNKARNRDLLKGGRNQHFRRVIIGASTQLFQQLGGCNAVIYYATKLFQQNIGLERRLSLILGGVLSVIYAIFALTSFLLVEKVGRRKLFLIGTVGQATAMFITFGCLVAGGAGPAKGGAFGLFLFIAFFGATWLPLPWLYPAELNSMSVRTQANAVSTCTNWLSNFLVVQVLPTMTASINAYTFLLFAIANCIFFPIIWVFYPETSGRTLEELDVLFAHAHITKRRPTLIADELPKLTDHQIQTMTDRYDIHGAVAADTSADDSRGAAEAQPNPDTTLPPAHPSGLNKTRDSESDIDATRAPTPNADAAVGSSAAPKIQ